MLQKCCCKKSFRRSAIYLFIIHSHISSLYVCKRLRAAYKLADSKKKVLSLNKINPFIASDVRTLGDQEELELSVNDSHSLLEALNKRVLKLGLRKQRHLRATISIPTSAQLQQRCEAKRCPLGLKGRTCPGCDPRRTN